MYRNLDEEKGFVILRLDKLMDKKRIKYRQRLNYIMKPGDVIVVPKIKDLVVLKINNTNINKELDKRVLADGQLHVPYFKGKRAKWYVKNYMGGKNDNGTYKRMTVVDANGRLKKTKNFIIFHLTPKVRNGAVVRLGGKIPEKPEPEVKEKKDAPDKVVVEAPAPEAPKTPVNWGVVLQQTLTTLTATLTTILLIQRLD
jgi:hypothetical protein